MKILITVLFFLTSSNSFAQLHPNEPAGSTTILDCAFNTALCGGVLKDDYNSSGLNASPPSMHSLNVVSDSSAPISGPNVLESRLTYPNKNGGTEIHYFAPRDIRNVYVSFWWKPGPFGGNGVGWNKTFFIRSGKPGSNGVFLWSNRYGDNLAANGDLGMLMWNTQIVGTNTDRCGGEGLQCRPNVNITRIAPGNWYHIEARMVASSCPTCYDGSVKWWVNGILNGDYPNFAYATSLGEWVWSETWDGYGNGTVPAGYTQDNVHRIDHLHISSTDCPGCTTAGDGNGGSNSGGNTNPPSLVAPKSLRFI